MTPEQIDIALSELETRVDRLRALYEQYFMGIERLEPHVPRKDVERRFNELRKVPFRNTARRFKFQTLVQRYSTMQQYWQRICREIENGTYKRHKLRAEKAFGPLVERKTSPAEELDLRSDEPKDRELPTLDEDDASDEALKAALAAATAAVARPPEGGRGLLGQLKTREGPGGTTLPVAHLPRPQVALPGAPLAPLPAAPLPGAPLPAVPPPRPAVSPAAPPLAGESNAAPKAPAATASTAGGPPPLRPPAPAGPPPVPAAERATTDVRRIPPPAPRPATDPERPRATPPNATLAEERIHKLHREYLDARAKTNATPVSYEKLAQNLRETESKLRAQHSGRDVDFEVVIKDGKAILKPKLR